MADLFSTLSPCRLHCCPFGITSTKTCHRVSITPNLERTRRGGIASATQAGEQDGWIEAGAAPLATLCTLRSEERFASSKGLQSLTILLALGSAAYLAFPDAASARELHDRLQHLHPLAADLDQLAESEDFWSNILRYVSYFFSVLLGTAYTAIKPVGGFLRKPVSAIITVAVVIGLYIFVSSTVNAMLGVNQDDVLLLPPLSGGSG